MTRFCSLAFACSLLIAVAATTPAQGQAAGSANQMGNSMSMAGAAPAFDYQAKFLADMKDVQSKFVGLAQAIPQDKFTWRPGDGVRSVAEVFLHVAGGNYGLTQIMGAPPAPGYNRQGFETSTTDKAAIIDQLNKSFAYMDDYVQSLSPADLQKAHQMFGRASTGYDVLFTIIDDLHEHLGQQIAYARQNGVVPPWTAERQATQAARGRGMGNGAGGAPPKQ
jgi:uncharacterized damage-inducible protein DinB